MKKLELFVMLFLVMNSIFAQSESSKLSYQAVVRNSSNELVTNQNVQVVITILNAANVSQYGETHAVMTNQNGLLSIMIGEGSSKTGDFSQIAWKDAVIRSVITLPGGATVTQNTPVTAMPYALYAESLNESALAQYLSDNHYVTESQLPVIPAQVNADWNATEGAAMILNKPEIPTLPTLATVATTGSYNDLSDLPSIPTVPNNVSGFNNDAHYVNNATCDTISFCELVAMIRLMQEKIDNLQETINSLSTTTSTLPTITTSSISNITESSAISGGIVTDDGGENLIAKGICWSTIQNPTIADNTTDNGTGIGVFNSSITGLSANTTYYVRAYATNNNGTAYGNEISFTTLSAPVDGQSCPSAAIVIDVDSNIYNTVQIGSQCWMKENLKSAHFSDGTGINSVNPSPNYSGPAGANRYYNSGNWFYNWDAVMHGSSSSVANPSGVQGVCPVGWHVPSENEYKQLISYIKSNNEYTCNGIENNTAKALASKNGWTTSTKACAVGNTPSNNDTTGFTALPKGYFSSAGFFSSVGKESCFATSTESSSSQIRIFHISYDQAYAAVVNYFDGGVSGGTNAIKRDAFSVRCVKD